MQKIDKQVVGEKIAWVAEAIGTRELFRGRAQQAAAELGVSCIDMLPSFFHQSPPQPASRFTSLGEWMSVCQVAIFEILYYFREPALPLVRKVAYGVYDWTQIHAIQILCRFAIEGLEREQIDTELGQELPHFRYETVMSTRNDLAALSPLAPRLAAAYQKLIQEYLEDVDPVDALDLIDPFVYYNPEQGKRYAPFLRKLMNGEGLAKRHPVLDGHVVSTNPDGAQVVDGTPLPQDFHAIRAALVLLRLFPTDENVIAHLRDWSLNHPNEKIRAELHEHLTVVDP